MGSFCMDEAKNYQEWLEKALDDELSAISIVKHKDGSPNTACFLAQQMAEKCLKGLLVSYEILPPKTHDLVKLKNLFFEKGTTVSVGKDFENDIAVLNRYYIETRYPGDYPEFHWGDGEEALESAKRVKRFVLDEIARAES
jgi:HEPN domain-containing protein